MVVILQLDKMQQILGGVIGFLLIGFTVYQLQILSRLEFKANTAKRGA